jgi:hypothetical protein
MVYCLTSRLNAGEYLLLANRPPVGPFSFRSPDDVKRFLNPYYKALTTLSPTTKEFRGMLSKLLMFHPVMIGIKENEALPIIEQWRQSPMAYICQKPVFIEEPYILLPMQAGFIDTYRKLDIVKDIELIPRIDSDGRITIHKFRTDHLWDKGNDHTIEPLTEDMANKILKERGFM